jgi:replication fork protection complex subunit Csm3/Swi3
LVKENTHFILMSASLQDIWDEPVENTIAQATRSTESLFLPDPDDDNTHSVPQTSSRPSALGAASARADIDALFADLDDLEDDGELKALAPALDLDALKRQADARNAQGMGSSQAPSSSMTGLHRIMPSSSPPRDMGDSTKGKDKDSAGEKKTIKRAPPLNEARLLGEDGFPALIKSLKGFKVKGKGHEVGRAGFMLSSVIFPC